MNLRNRYRSHLRKSSHQLQGINEKLNESRALWELTSYIEKAVNSGTLLFPLSDIHSMYLNRLEDFGITKQINKTRLKVNLLEKFPEAQEQHDGKNTIIVFEEGMKNMLREALKKQDFTEDVAMTSSPMITSNSLVVSRQSARKTHCLQVSSLWSRLYSMVPI